jgi:outer membrane murein-binding lipoprotein Lpp
MDASFEKMMSSFSMENKEVTDRSTVIWTTIMDKQDAKIELEREKVEAAKMEAHAATMKATNEATQLSWPR